MADLPPPEENTCPFCQYIFAPTTGDAAFLTICGHIICHTCIRVMLDVLAWFDLPHKCPVCSLFLTYPSCGHNIPVQIAFDPNTPAPIPLPSNWPEECDECIYNAAVTEGILDAPRRLRLQEQSWKELVEDLSDKQTPQDPKQRYDCMQRLYYLEIEVLKEKEKFLALLRSSGKW